MGIDAGFDMVPPLSNGIVDRQNWGRFINFVREHYKDDSRLEIKPNYLNFNAGEHPKLPFECHKFLRFSSKISGSTAYSTGIEHYIATVTRVARSYFGSRVQSWNEGADRYGYYDWNQVNESLRSYEQPDELETPTGVAHFLNGSDPLEQLDIPLFEIKDIPGKGKGLVARCNISRGTRILREKPFFTMRAQPPEDLESLLVKQLKSLSRTLQRQFLALHNNFPGKNPFSGIFKTNALPCGAGSSIGGLYPNVCLINHSCVPNAHNNWNSTDQHETIHAICPIEKGEEITISYDHGGPSSERQTFLKKSFGFTCNCGGCSAPLSSLKASDNRRIQIQSLDDAIGNLYRMRVNPHESLNDCYLLLQVLEKEFCGYAGALIPRLYYDAFQISIAHGDRARACVFAERAYKARVVCEGEDSPATLRVKSLALSPEGDSSFEMYSRRWRTTRDLLPKGLDTMEFDKWLFRQQS